MPLMGSMASDRGKPAEAVTAGPMDTGALLAQLEAVGCAPQPRIPALAKLIGYDPPTSAVPRRAA